MKKRSHPEYVLQDDTFVLLSEQGKELLVTSEIWMMINVKTGDILRHGAKLVVGSDFDQLQETLRRFNTNDAVSLANQIVLCNVTKLPLEEINRALIIQGYILTALTRFGIKTCREWKS